MTRKSGSSSRSTASQRTAPVLADADIDYDRAGELVTVSLPSVKQNEISGTVSFYRPSDAGLDTNVEPGPGRRPDAKA